MKRIHFLPDVSTMSNRYFPLVVSSISLSKWFSDLNQMSTKRCHWVHEPIVGSIRSMYLSSKNLLKTEVFPHWSPIKHLWKSAKSHQEKKNLPFWRLEWLDLFCPFHLSFHFFCSANKRMRTNFKNLANRNVAATYRFWRKRRCCWRRRFFLAKQNAHLCKRFSKEIVLQ